LSRKTILEKLIYDEKEEFEKLVDKAVKLVKVRENGEPVILHKAELTDAEKICCYLLGIYFSKELGILDKSSATNDEIAKSLGIEIKKTNARLNDLKNNDIVERISRGEYKISLINIENYLDGILTKLEVNEGD